ncbi:MAG TPA: hypothetical protein VLZ83_01020 [Edaphocola sp.]|nr:hypothetical protein [Edaphocola sp.]
MKNFLSYIILFLFFLSANPLIGQINTNIRKDTIVNAEYNYCQRIGFDLNANNNNFKNVPHTIIKNTKNYFLLAYNDISPESNSFAPYFRISDRYQNTIAGYFLTADFSSLGVGNVNVYLTDVSEISGSDYTVFITGFINPIDASPDYIRCIPFIAEIDMFNGSIKQLKIVKNESIVFYRILHDSIKNQVIVSGEKFKNNSFDPMYYNNIGNSNIHSPEGDAIAISFNSMDLNEIKWNINGISMTEITGEECIGSTFEKVIRTPKGYFIVGRKIIDNYGQGIFPVNGRVECVFLDFNGNIIWQKSLNLSNYFSRGVSAYYSQEYNKVFVLFQSTFTHGFGLFALNNDNGTHQNITFINGLPGETNVVDLFKWNNESFITVGGMYQKSSSNSVFTPFWASFKYNKIDDCFTYLDSTLNTNDKSMGMDGGIDYYSSDFSEYFSWTYNSFSMFDVDKREFPFPPQLPFTISYFIEPSFLFSTKDSLNSSVEIYKINFDHCSCPFDYGFELNSLCVNVPSLSPLNLIDLHYQIENIEQKYLTLDLINAYLKCGMNDSLTYPPFINIKTNMDIGNFGNVIIFDVLGKVIFRGVYSDFLNNKSKYNIINKVLFIKDLKTKETKKTVFLN